MDLDVNYSVRSSVKIIFLVPLKASKSIFSDIGVKYEAMIG